MQLRVAKHTDDLVAIIEFYQSVFGLQILGSFNDHEGYDGVFLGYKDFDWHLEFTHSRHTIDRKEDPDDLLVFYYYSQHEINEVLRQAKSYELELVQPRNPYWQTHGALIQDVDGNKIILASREVSLISEHPIIKLANDKGISTWSSLIDFIRKLPYGRIENSKGLIDILKQGRGTCSTKHALLKNVADIIGLKEVRLILCIYKMTNSNTPGIGTEMHDIGLDYIPEAHCYLKVLGKRVDVTTSFSKIERIENDILEEIEIESNQITEFKVQYHKAYITKWINENDLDLSLESVWKLREKCILNLTKSN